MVTAQLYNLPQGQGQAMKLHTDGVRRSTTIAASSRTGAPVNIARDTLLLSRRRVAALANSRDYLIAMRRAFEGLAAGQYQLPAVGHIPGSEGAFHVKPAVRSGNHPRAAIKINGNFPGNASRSGLPTIQGCIVLLDASDGRVLAIMDSIEITARRTAAATALAARHLARLGTSTLAIVGCGMQSGYHVDALLDVLPIIRVNYCDPRDAAARSMAAHLERIGLDGFRMPTPADAARGADVIVTLTTSTRPLLAHADVSEGAFVAGVGADSPSKHELAVDLIAGSRVVADLLSQSSTMGDLHHAIVAGAISAPHVHGELADIVAGRIPGRTAATDRFVFDSTGIALQDLAAAEMIYERARASDPGPGILFDD
jgi:ornithine cyclodeaminase/alanine dehydrogenase-like protein (mu-crystallin family)